MRIGLIAVVFAILVFLALVRCQADFFAMMPPVL